MEVIDHRLQSIGDEMEDTLLKTSFSMIVKEMRDASAAIFDAKGRTIAQSAAMPSQLGMLTFSVPAIIREFPVTEAQEGDVYIHNDPFSGGTHLPDITVVEPVIYNGEVVALAASMVHHADTGGIVPGVSTAATSIYHEGLCIPPVKFYDAGKPVKAIHDIIKSNVRIPEEIHGDLEAQVACGKVGKDRILELCDEYGKEVLLAALEGLLNHAETLTRQALEAIPDGTYEFTDYIDNDGIDLEQRIKLQVAVTIKGSDITFDFTGSSPQTRGPLNCTPSSTFSAIAYAVKVVTGGSSISTNEGCFRPIKYVLPEGSIVNAKRPAATGIRGLTVQTLASTCLGALAKARPELVNACSGAFPPLLYIGGYDPLNDREYLSNDTGMCGLGARPTKDGVDAISNDIVNVLAIPVEAFEMFSPLTVIQCGLYEDSGGPGKYRGGLGWQKSFQLLRGSTSVTFRGERWYVPPWGLFGGLPGKTGYGYVKRHGGEITDIPSKSDYILNAGDEIWYSSPGGGGYGDPLEREPELVLSDVIDGRVSRQVAFDDYGVVIEESNIAVDVEKTKQRRQEIAKARGPITWIYDKGILGRE